MEAASNEAQAEFKKLQEALAMMQSMVEPDTQAKPDEAEPDEGPFVIPMARPVDDDGHTEPPSPAEAQEPQPMQEPHPEVKQEVKQETQPKRRQVAEPVEPRATQPKRRPVADPVEPPAGKRSPPEPLGLPPWKQPPPATPPWKVQPKHGLPAKMKAYPAACPTESVLPQTSKASSSSSSSALAPPNAAPPARQRGERRGKNFEWHLGLQQAKKAGREKQYRERYPQPFGDAAARAKQMQNVAAKKAKAEAGRKRSRSVSI